MTTKKFTKDYFYGAINRSFEIDEEYLNNFLNQLPAPSNISAATKGADISKMNDGDFLNGAIYAVSDVEKALTAKKDPFLKLSLSNASGGTKAKIFQGNSFRNDAEADAVVEELTGAIIKIQGKVNEFPRGSGYKSILIDSFEIIKSDFDPIQIIPQLDEPFEDVIVETIFRLDNNTNPYRQISLTFLKEFWNEYIFSPAAKTHHHAYLGGLMRHVLEMIAIDDFLHSFENPADGMDELLKVVVNEHINEMRIESKPEDGSNPKRYGYTIWGGDTISHITETIYKFRTLYDPETYNRNLTKAFYPMHDIGKILELGYPGIDQKQTLGKLFPFASDVDELNEKYNVNRNSIGYDELGQLMGHMPIGSMYLQHFFSRYNFELTAGELAHIHHLILSHHGKVEWNSTIVPQTAEACLFHLVDFLGSRYEGHLASLRD